MGLIKQLYGNLRCQESGTGQGSAWGVGYPDRDKTWSSGNNPVSSWAHTPGRATVQARIMVVGQEYGHKPPKVSLEMRHEMILQETGLQKTFGQRNPHMQGVTSALRLLYGIPLGADHESEFLQTDNDQA